MKFTKVLSVLLVIVVLACTLASCGGNSGLIGTWEADDASGTITFTNDKMILDSEELGELSGIEIMYKDLGSKIEITVEFSGQSTSETIEYALDGDTLTIMNTVFKRK